MDDYSTRTDESRFKKWDDLISPSSDNSKKMSIILIIGSIISIAMLGSSLITEFGKEEPLKYDYGLNISYDAQSSHYYIDFTNPNQTVSSLLVNIKIPYTTSTTSTYTTVYETSSSSFPSNISYKPYDKTMEHIITVTLVKPSGNYTCFFTNNPGDDDKIYNGITKYTDEINKYIQSNNTVS